ncbi:MAG: hypothetical protein K0R28_827 [Paenibacillus sp.]|nr:hypothetical protein [Paenibacillus sp.]
MALIFEYKSYNDILAMGYDYDTYYQVAEFKSPGIDPDSTGDDRIVSLLNTSSEAMQSITKGWYAKWIQYHTDAAQYLSYLYVLTGDAGYAAKAAEIVNEFAAKYPSYVLHDVVSPVLTNNDWAENSITFLNAPNHDPSGGEVTGVGETAFVLDTVLVGAVGTYQWEISDFLFAALQNGDRVSLVMAIQEERSDSYVDFNSDDGATKPVFYLEYRGT